MGKLIGKIKEQVSKINLKSLKNFGLVVLGTFILAVAVELFILPASLNTGGVSGYINISTLPVLNQSIIRFTSFAIQLQRLCIKPETSTSEF